MLIHFQSAQLTHDCQNAIHLVKFTFEKEKGFLIFYLTKVVESTSKMVGFFVIRYLFGLLITHIFA